VELEFNLINRNYVGEEKKRGKGKEKREGGKGSEWQELENTEHVRDLHSKSILLDWSSECRVGFDSSFAGR
jgi:hypothetical protein